MELHPDIQDILMKDFTNEELTDSESEMLTSWLNLNSKNQKVYAQMKLTFLNPGPKDIRNLRTEIWTKINNKRNNSVPSSNQDKGYFYWWGRVAAILVFMVSIALLLYQMGNSESNDSATLAEVKMIGKVSQPGQKLTTTLPDGSLVKLNGDSKILFAEDFSGESREVILYGEAFFEVVKNENKPFVINTKDIKVKVLGTSFNVKSYPGKASSMVAVASGKVAVTASNQQMMALKPGEKSSYLSESGTMVKESFNWEVEYGWKDNILVFKEAPLDEVYDKLSKWYGVEFIQQGEMPRKKFSGRYTNPTLKAVLEGLSYVYNFNYSIESKTVILKNKTNENNEL